MSDPDRHLHSVDDYEVERRMTPEELAIVIASEHDRVNAARARLQERLSRKADSQ